MYATKKRKVMQQVIEGTDFQVIAEKIKTLQNPKGELIHVVIETIPQKQEKKYSEKTEEIYREIENKAKSAKHGSRKDFVRLYDEINDLASSHND